MEDKEEEDKEEDMNMGIRAYRGKETDPITAKYWNEYWNRVRNTAKMSDINKTKQN